MWNDVDMPSTKPPRDREPAFNLEVTDDEQRELLQRAIEKRERLAESRLEMAKLFLQNGKSAIALRRLKEILGEFSGSKAAIEAKSLLKKVG